MTGRLTFDLLVVGGGINGAGIARDAAGRGLNVLLVEKDDLAAHTSSASTKLIHGGLRYLEQFEFGLVRESLIERERLWRTAPHLIHPLDFVVVLAGSQRPAWFFRLGLFLYDHLGGRKSFPATRTIHLETDPRGDGLKHRAGKAFVYTDCQVDDSRLVLLNALDAAEHGARIATRTELISAVRTRNEWQATLRGPTGDERVNARVLINATGPWVATLFERIDIESRSKLRLVKGSHIVLPRLYSGEHAVLIQNSDRRVAFAIPFESEFTLVGTTDAFWQGEPATPEIDDSEIDYLLDAVRQTFARSVVREDIVWTYSGIRGLFDNGSNVASNITRDYQLELDEQGAPVLSIFGGKLTTYRRLAEQAMHRLTHLFPNAGGPWTETAVLPGGDLRNGSLAELRAALCIEFPALPSEMLDRFARTYGTRARGVLRNVATLDDMGSVLGDYLTEREVKYLVAEEWAQTAEDILFRRTKVGLHSPPSTSAWLDQFLKRSKIRHRPQPG
jgi:glycerol-3-phosphate dehydrogenase